MRLIIFWLVLSPLSPLLNLATAQVRVKSDIIVPHGGMATSGTIKLDIESPTRSSKSVLLAVVSSLILPGMGELYADNFSTGKYSLMVEAGLWLTYGGFQAHGQWLREDARSFALQHGNAFLDGKDSQFEVNLGNFTTVEEYNEAKLRNRQYELMYDPNSSFAWRWDNDGNRLTFKNQRIRSDEVLQNSKFVLGALVLNRIISAFSAGRSAAAYNRSLSSQGAWRLDTHVLGGRQFGNGIELRVTRDF
ncbi:MAG: hypothetical protein UX72_C0010G0003 [Parcubacteria group bacterium GW2011_GWA2_47_10]|nr:MAG: hypothetical protein UX72_C0010G0003 [Parcubacteria group bacterium GW2011_GWA2_47_10]HAL55990.1 hypothetical protein [Bacteroidota bacterium]